MALATRPQLSAIGPLAPGIIGELGTPYAFVGLLTTIPVLCMGIFAPVGPGIVHMLGVRAGIAASVGLLLLFAILRPFAPTEASLLILTFGIGVGTALAGPMLPMFVRGRLSVRMVAGTAAYASGTIIGAAIASAIAVPLETALGGWRASLLAISLACLPALVLWIVLVRNSPVGLRRASSAARKADHGSSSRVMSRLPVHRPIAWVIGVLFGMQSWLYYGTSAWLPSVYIERGWDPSAAGFLLTIMSVGSLSGIVLVPWLSRRGASRRLLLASAACASATALLGVALVPDPALLWTLLLGAGIGVTFTLVLTLPTDISHDSRETGGAAALMFLIGYLMASLAPFVLGAARDATGDFVASLWLLVAIAVVMIPMAWSLSPRRLRPLRPAAPAG